MMRLSSPLRLLFWLLPGGRPKAFPLFLLGMLLIPISLAPSCKTQSEATEEATVLEPSPVDSPEGENGSETPISNPATDQSGMQWPSDDQKILELRRTPCFGKCPVDHTILYADGTVRYMGTQNVDHLGLYKGQLAAGAWDGIFDQADMIDFWSMEERYPTGDNRIMDLPSERLWLSDGERDKQVINQRYANPEADGEQQTVEQLNSLAASVIQLLDEADLKFLQAPPGRQ